MSCERLTWDLLVRAVDNELSAEEIEFVTGHLAGCAHCRREYESIQSFSRRVGSAVNGAAIVEHLGDRGQLAAAISRKEAAKAVRHAPEKVMRRFGWGMAIAATLALAIVVAPKQKGPAANISAGGKPAAVVSNAIEVEGETFIALPYSNPDLPSISPRIVQMQVPLSSLADIGIALEPVANEILSQDRSVLADVLLGADGQPLGVHVLSSE
jgi:hypothetical protein